MERHYSNFTTNNLLATNQHGFHVGHSCVTQLLKVMDSLAWPERFFRFSLWWPQRKTEKSGLATRDLSNEGVD